MLLAPYGGTLVNAVAEGAAAVEARQHAAALPQLQISGVTLSDLYLIAVGGLSPLTGFMGRADYDAVVDQMTLANGLPWSIPITLPISAADAQRFGAGSELCLVAPDGRPAALLRVTETFRWDAEREATRVYGTPDTKHPGVARLHQSGDHALAGPITYFYDRDVSGFPSHHLTPAETRAEFERRGWKTVVGFQTRNPVHRAHEYLQKCALELIDGLLLHPLVGDTKQDDIPAAVRMECYETLLEHYYARDRVVLSVLPAAMRYAGPREAVFHAIMRRNYGCTHFIVGRDHAGVGDYYGSYDAQRIFDRVDMAKLGIQTMPFEHAFFCTQCDQMVTARTCPHDRAHHVILSGTKVRDMLARGERPPATFARPEVADVLIRAYANEVTV